jgi:hypothetical protein
MRILFKGRDYVVILADDRELTKAQRSGIIIQREGQLYTRDGRKVIITSTPIEPHSSCNRLSNPMPYISDKVKDNDFFLTAYGSVNMIKSNLVYTNWHVVDKVGEIKLCNLGISLALQKVWKPNVIPYWAYALVTWLQKYIPIKPRYSFFDYAELHAPYSVDDIVNWRITPNLVYTAGTCSDVNQQNCIGVALPIPIPGIQQPINIPTDYIGYCTYWGYGFTGKVMDVGEATVYYEDGVAVFMYAYLLNFYDKPGIPGCSGSPIIVYNKPNQDSLASKVTVTVNVREIQ